jgi:hypothetical protein
MREHQAAYSQPPVMGRHSDNTLVPAAGVCAEFGVCRRTLARWAEDAMLGFPTPTIIKGRWFFRRASIEAWKVEQSKISAAGRR